MSEFDFFSVVFLTTLIVSLFWQVLWLAVSNGRLNDELSKLKEKND